MKRAAFRGSIPAKWELEGLIIAWNPGKGVRFRELRSYISVHGIWHH